MFFNRIEGGRLATFFYALVIHVSTAVGSIILLNPRQAGERDDLLFPQR